MPTTARRAEAPARPSLEPAPGPGRQATPTPSRVRAYPAGLRGAFANIEREHGFEPLEVEGTLPAELAGTLVRNGPGLFELFGRRYDHWFEGDGALTAVRFFQGQAEGALRLVESAGLVEERRAGRMLYNTSAPWPRRVRNMLRGKGKNTANTSVAFWQGRLFALMEGGLPTEVDPKTLATLGETDLDGVVPTAFSAHPHRVEARGALYNFGVRYGKETHLDLFELPDEGPARRLTSVPLSAPVMLHDFMATEKHLVAFVHPAKVQIWRFFLQVGGFTDFFQWDEGAPSEVIVVPIDRPEDVVRFEVAPFYQWHFANAFERGDEIVVDYCRYPDFGTFGDLQKLSRGEVSPAREQGHLHRTVIRPASCTLTEEILDEEATEFPRVAPAVEGGAYRYVYLAQASGEDGVVKLDLETGRRERFEFEGKTFCSEPVFVPRPGGVAEDEGWLLSVVYDADEGRSHCAVLDAQRVLDGPVARAHFGHRAPISFHGTFLPG